MRLGFAGLGLMGSPMASNLRSAGFDITVYNRSPGPRAGFADGTAAVVATPDALFAQSDAIFLMLADDTAVDMVTGRGGPHFPSRVAGRLVINMGTHAPDWSKRLESDVLAAGGRFVEAPVSGSRGLAVAGTLVAMVAGDPQSVEAVLPLLRPLCRETFVTGAVPTALTMKLAVNLYLIATVAALAEAANLARAAGLDLALFERIVASGPLCSEVAVAKLAKMVGGDFAPEAAIADVCKNAALVAAAAAAAGAAAPLLTHSRQLFEQVHAADGARLDMAAVIAAFRTVSDHSIAD